MNSFGSAARITKLLGRIRSTGKSGTSPKAIKISFAPETVDPIGTAIKNAVAKRSKKSNLINA